MSADESRVTIPVIPGINCLIATRSPAVRSGHIIDAVGEVKFLERVVGGINLCLHNIICADFD